MNAKAIMSNKIFIFVIFLCTVIAISVQYSKVYTPVDEVQAVIDGMRVEDNTIDDTTYSMMKTILESVKSPKIQIVFNVLTAMISLLMSSIVCIITLKIDERKLPNNEKTYAGDILRVLFPTLYFVSVKNVINFGYVVCTDKLLYYNTTLYALIGGIVSLITSIYILKRFHDRKLSDGSSRKIVVTDVVFVISVALYAVILFV